MKPFYGIKPIADKMNLSTKYQRFNKIRLDPKIGQKLKSFLVFTHDPLDDFRISW